MKCTALLFLSLIATPVSAFDDRTTIEGFDVEVFAPNWCWEGDPVSVLIRVTPPAEVTASYSVRAELVYPEAAFEFADESQASLLREGLQGPAYLAIKRLVPKRKVATSDASTSLHQLILSIEIVPSEAAAGDLAHSFSFELETVRGSLVPQGLWSILAPAVISLVALPIFLIFLRRHGVKAWWRETRAVAGVDHE